MLPTFRRRAAALQQSRQVLAGGAALSAMGMLRLGFGGTAFASEGFGPLVPDPNGLLDLPRGTTILVRNHELGIGTSQFVPGPDDRRYDPAQGTDPQGNPFKLRGGTTTLILDRRNNLIASYPSIAGTSTNCAGGPTPWHSWLTCEETTLNPDSDPRATRKHGYVFEVPATATGPVRPVALTAMGRFSHEAVCVDPQTGIVYETEDSGTSVLYRFRPRVPGHLARGGVLEALKLVDFPSGVNTATDLPAGVEFEAEWVPIPNPDWSTGEACCSQQAREQGAAVISRGEGIWWSEKDDAAFIVSTSGGQAGRRSGRRERHVGRAGQHHRRALGRPRHLRRRRRRRVPLDRLEGPRRVQVRPERAGWWGVRRRLLLEGRQDALREHPIARPHLRDHRAVPADPWRPALGDAAIGPWSSGGASPRRPARRRQAVTAAEGSGSSHPPWRSDLTRAPGP